MPVKFANNATTTLAQDLTLSATSVVVATSTGGVFPALSDGDFCFVTLMDTSNHLEVVKVTARSGDTLTVSRGQDGTVARAFPAGSKVELRVVAAALAAKTDSDAPRLTGNISLTSSAPTITFDRPDDSAPVTFRSVVNTSPRWILALGDSSTDFGVARYSASGTFQADAFRIAWTDGAVSFASDSLTAGGHEVWHAGNLPKTGFLSSDGGTVDGSVTLSCTDPQIGLVDPAGRSVWWQVDNEYLYLLRAGVGASSPSAVNGVWPLAINLDNNTAVFGGNISTATYGMLHDYFAVKSGENIFTQRQAIVCDAATLRLQSGTNAWQIGNFISDANFWIFQFQDTSNWRAKIDGGGNLTARGTVTSGSDVRVKADIEDIIDALRTVRNLRGRRFRRLDQADTARLHLGVVAQEVQPHVPEVIEHVVAEGVDMLTVNYDALVPLLIEAVKTLATSVETLTARVSVLEEK